MTPSVVWFRRDLRLADNPALAAAADRGSVIPLFVLDDRLRDPSGPNRLAFLYGSLRHLDGRLGGSLVVRTGRPADVVPAVASEAGAAHVFAAADFGPYGRDRDAAVEQALDGAGIAFEAVGSPYAVAPGTVRKKDGAAYRVFTPFYRAWRTAGWDKPIDARPRIAADHDLASEGVPSDPAGTAPDLPPAGEAAGLEQLRGALGRVAEYADTRDRPDLDRTTRLSPYLKYGCVHPRQVLAGLGRGKGAERLRTELAWREFYADVLWHEPASHHEALQPQMKAMRNDEGPDADERFDAWAAGRTGYPIVDAGMRQLLVEGWMHNRVRMIVASFLVKDLHLDWWRGARYFLHHLVDGDLASNNHGWQWVAGTGTDPAPYYRIFNPTKQAETFDPEGAYVRRYVPEIGTDAYPAPIVDHADERAEALRRYEEVRR